MLPIEVDTGHIGATTLCITTFSITTLSIMTFSTTINKS
jgi:hypothetical protein